VRLSLIYTGRSLGALGALRSQDEHDLLTEQANVEKRPFRLVSHACWRAPGITIFLPGDEPEGDELRRLLTKRVEAQHYDSRPALRSNGALLVQDPEMEGPDLLELLRRNPRAALDFPDLREARARLHRVQLTKKKVAWIVEEAGAAWPEDPETFNVGEMNRVDIEGARLYELPVNLGEIGPRATLLARAIAEARAAGSEPLLVDLGERDGDLGLERAERARIDYVALQRIGYQLSVPFELELALGKAGLLRLREAFPALGFLATNVKVKGAPELFEPRRMIETAGVKIGLIGLVDPDVRGQLPREVLADFVVEPLLAAAEREARALRAAGADAVIALSNLHPRDNAVVARDAHGIDAVVADLHVRWSPEELRSRVELPDRPWSRPGSPALVARGFANGLGVGRLDLAFRRGPSASGWVLSSMSHELRSVTDRVAPDTALVAEVRALRKAAERPRGEMLFPAFLDITARHPKLGEYDATTAQGRVSKSMWEQFMARLLRRRGQAEVALVRKLPHFPPLIGKLHEEEVRSWLWTEDAVVLLDLQGIDLRKILEEDVRGDLVTSGIDRAKLTVNGRHLDELVYYRIATTDTLFEGARFRDFEKARRVRRAFRIDDDGMLDASRSGAPLLLRDLVLGELRRVREAGKGDAQVDRVAALLEPDAPFENLLTFNFDRPTLFTSLSRARNNEAYGSVPESRVTADESWLGGVNGRFKLTQDRRVFSLESGLTFAYSKQSVTNVNGKHTSTEMSDDLKLDLTVKPKPQGLRPWKPQLFARALFDSEFTPTVNPQTGASNPRQLALRGSSGIALANSRHWRNLELGVAVENDFGRPNVQFGFQARADFTQPFGPLGRLNYRMRNDLTYFFPAAKDDASSLGLRYGMIHELLVPLKDEMMLSVAADLFVFRGKTDATSKLGSSLMLRIGLTYDRLWKPRYQPLF
jgi:hypothetical protein